MARKKGAEDALSTGLPPDYAEFLESLKARVRQAQTRAALSVSRELILLYWGIGRDVVERQEQANWGQHVLERLGDDLQRALPGVGGFSRSNVFRMRAFVLACLAPEIVAQPVRQMAWAAPTEPVAPLPWLSARRMPSLPGASKKIWPSIEEIEAELGTEDST